jgi:sugar phosphate isomerase/epimerase
MIRREFLKQAAAATAGIAVVSGSTWAQGAAPSRAQQSKVDRIAIMSYSFGSVLKTAGPDDPKRTLDLMDLPQMYADRFGVHNIELQHSHLLSTEPEYLKAFLARVKKVKSRVTNINAEFGALNMSVADPVRRLETIDLTKRWVDHAVMLQCPRIMLNQGTLAPEVRQTAIQALRTMGKYGDAHHVSLTLENRGYTGAWEPIVEVVKAAGTYTNPDFGNYPNTEMQLQGIRGMMPYNRGNVHVKIDETRQDFRSAIALSRELGYKGLYSIEATPNVSPDPYVATKTVYDALLAAL